MAAGRDMFGKLDLNYWLQELNKTTTQTSASKVISNMMDAANWLGVTNNDQKAVTQLLQEFSKKYPKVDITKTLNLWDPSKNSINSFELKDAMNTWATDSEDKALKAKAQADAEKMFKEAQQKQLQNDAFKELNKMIASGEDKKDPAKAQALADISMGKTPGNTTAEKQANKAVETAKTNASDAKYDQLLTAYNNLQNDISILKSQQPRKIGADEAAELYNINVNYDDKLKEYNDKTNTYFDEAIGLEKLYRDQMQQDNANYQDASLRSYLNSYQNAAPTASRKGAVAATALLNMLGNSADLAQADSASGQSIINQEARRRAELANNPYLAQTDINNLRTYLSTLSTGLHSADVQKHAGEISSYATEYSGKRAGLAQAAVGAAYKYQGLANAAATRAQNAALNNYEKMYNYYYSKYPELANTFASNKINAQYYPSANK